MNNYNWIFSNRDEILNNSIDQVDLSFKFALDLQSTSFKHIFLKLENSNIYFHGIFVLRKKLKILDSTYSGYIIPKKEEKIYKKNFQLINFTLKKKIKTLKLDLILIKPSPLLIYKNYRYLTQTLQFNGYFEINGYHSIFAEQFSIESYNLRREIKIGKKNLNNFEIIDEKHENFKNIFFSLIDYKLKQKVSIENLNHLYINIKKGIYNIKVVIDNETIVCLIIISVFGQMATQTYNYNNPKYRNLFVNKSLHYEIIEDLFKSKEKKIFIFGDTIDSDKNLTNLTEFKERFSNSQLLSISIFVPISLMGLIYVYLKKIKNLIIK